ncbi:uncharacterized protein LOC111697748 [Eurytemora carolleeae]|uniref:uncharacterized protein LOC111697748 n=1 Tax=Eurytemora carolleeae TaxID=1294199 RepID=UPI000C761B68|nr:uncharacterized protein LOC111697748 [Eurytemora carolleeae]|eukprot:XP_023323623.1 uncharacterized protein LOC111697748 [Eurytemora affinis]
MFIAIFSHQESCIGNFQYKCKKALASTVLTVVDLEEVSEQYKLLKLGIELVAFFSITFCQTAITLTIFFLVKDHRKWTIGLGTSGLILLVYDLVESFEGVYELVAKVAAKGKDDAYFNTKLEDVLKVRDAADELQTSKPLTGAGYFNVEKTTLTAMVSTTATYAVILYQMA